MQSVHVTVREAGADPGFWAQKVSTCVVHAAHISAANRLASNRLAVARAVGGGGGGGGGGGILGMCHFKTVFSPKFPLQSR